MDHQTISVLLIEDNPGDVRLVKEVLAEAGRAMQFDLKWAKDLLKGMQLLAEEKIDVVLLDLNLPNSLGLESLEKLKTQAISLPIIPLTGLDDESLGEQAVRAGAQDYLVKGQVDGSRLVCAILYAIERKQLENQLKASQERVVHLNDVLSAIRNINQMILRENEPAKVLQSACDILAQTRGYLLAWIGVAEKGSSKVIPTVQGGTDADYLEKIHITWDESADGQGPTGRAMRLRSAQFCQDMRTDPSYAPWREQALSHGFASSAAMPILHEDRLFGVLSVYAVQPNAFNAEEASLLNELAGDLGYALNSLEQGQKRSQAEDELRALLLRHEALLMAIPEIVTEVDVNKVYRWVNPAGIEFFGEEVVGKEAADYFIGEQDTYQIVKPVFNGAEETIYTESWQRRKDGEKRLLAWWCRSLKDSQGNTTGALSTARDITESRLAEEALRKTAWQLARSQEIGHLGSWDWDIAQNSLVWSDEIYRIWGVDQDFPLSYETIAGMIHPQDRELNDRNLQDFLKTNNEGAFEFRIICPDGQVKHIYQSIEVTRDPNGQATRIFGIMQDITERKRAEQQLADYTNKLEEMVAERTHALREAQEQLLRQERLATLGQLAGGVSHELRNPLGVIANAVYYLKMIQPDASEKIKQYHTILEEETRAAEKIISDLFDFSRDMYVDREAIAAPELAHNILQRHPAPPGVNVAQDFEASLPRLYADSYQMTQVLGNLIVNAYQAMPKGKGGEVTIRGRRSTLDNQPAVAISVSDSGVGIPPENMEKIFEPLFTTKPRGIGLGLAVCKKLVEANNGRIEVQSESGQGSTFTIVLPARKEKPKINPPDQAPN
jgi:PAS domain S-box-containing protein